MLPDKLHHKLSQRAENHAKRELSPTQDLIDFSSNDYLGLSHKNEILVQAESILEGYNHGSHGATGSRLLSGNYPLLTDLEQYLAAYYRQPSALIFNSGYDANLGLLSCVAQRNDIVLYDQWVHASIRDGLKLSQAKTYKFKHNELRDLESQLLKYSPQDSNHIYVVTESVFSMDGDSPDLKALAALCQQYRAYLIVDEAHAVGLYPKGLVAELQLESTVFAQVVTFGKALGAHGAAVLGGADLVSYLINYARSLIYTTALPPHSAALIWAAHRHLEPQAGSLSKLLYANIAILRQHAIDKGITNRIGESDSAIQVFHIPGNSRARAAAAHLQANGFDVRAILSPTVPVGKERLRICIHSFNNQEQIKEMVSLLATFAG